MSTPREYLLETTFCDIPQNIAGITLRPLSAGSFTLLGRLGNPMMVGGASNQADIFDAVIQYVWIHSADIDDVISIEKLEDVPALGIKKLGFQISLGQALQFLETYKQCAARMTASLAEVEEDDDAPGKPAAQVPAPAGLPLSSLPSVQPETPAESDTSSGFNPLSDPLPIFTLPVLPTETVADGPAPPTQTPMDSSPHP